jgi:hypothetical protein
MDNTFDLVMVGTGAAASTIANRCRAAGWSVARKIRSCSLRTLRSTAGQSMPDQLWRAPRPAVGSVLVTV